MIEFLGGGGCNFDSILQALSGLWWSGVRIRNMLNAYPEVYKAYREVHHFANEAARWRADYYRLCDVQPRPIGGEGSVEIVGQT